MEYEYAISGMTCGGCVESVKNSLNSLKEIKNIKVSLDSHSILISSDHKIKAEDLQKHLPQKYTIGPIIVSNISSNSKLKELLPLFIIFFYLIVSVLIYNWNDLIISNLMYDFMGLFYIVFSLFKFLDLKNFSPAFTKYDPIANKIPFYSTIYPFIETLLGLMFLNRIELFLALVLTLIILSATSFGVLRILIRKEKIQCACLGTAIKLPMTTVTLIENSIMIVMAAWMILTF